ncbi:MULTISPECIES: HAD family hydrolase [unclassified Arenibacter]|jgi:Cof subfamily protein (haloacid dehalogenase superfamily)|uniref:HAD family hydrolase n=1 Tax=unclassified Arenibacter TaxID=2615047 RepID=UPI000E345E63|nr:MULTISPECIES: HAD family hydrolase [unclassified Arenibacter]MCM4165837.1 Cof-type HAD-IIB family hydrolase [Arenibacter sp. A80]RFT54457.1 HAD family phosphatase [Arenibacter sp. P308M17]
MDLSKVKMVVTDMDGTLLNSKHEVSNKFFQLFEELKKRDIRFVAASGRQYNSIVDKLNTIKDDIIIVAENGAFVKEQDQELLATPLNQTIIKDIIELLRNVADIHPVLCGKNNAYINGNSDEFINKLREYYSEFSILNDIASFDGEVLKIAIYHFESSEKYILPLVNHLESILKVKVSGEHWLDISHMNANKGYALQHIQEKYGIGRQETLVFGDYNNDLEMLAMADLSFAMANAHPNVTAAAKYRTKSNDESGVEDILEKLLNS